MTCCNYMKFRLTLRTWTNVHQARSMIYMHRQTRRVIYNKSKRVMLIKAKHMDFDYSIHYDEQLDISSTNHFSPKETI